MVMVGVGVRVKLAVVLDERIPAVGGFTRVHTEFTGCIGWKGCRERDSQGFMGRGCRGSGYLSHADID